MNYYQEFLKFPINEHYLNRYLQFLSSCNSTVGYLEKHHILPKSLFPEFKTDSRNLISLTARQHFIAHWMLSKIFIKYKHKASMLKAFYRMTNYSKHNAERGLISSRLFEKAKLANSEAMKISNPMQDPNTRAKMSKSFRLFLESEEGLEMRKKQSESRKGINNISKEGIDRLSNLWKGVLRPKTEQQIKKNREHSSVGLFITPFGIFYSPGEASRSVLNRDKLSRYLINKFCKENVNGYLFESFNKEERRGKWKRV